jgi:integrative and conjugative element protein (TIGR02256 family)
MKKSLKLNIQSLQISFEQDAISDLISKAQTSTTDNERGGVLLGEIFLNNSTILVTHIIESQKAKTKRYGFLMNVDEVQKTINDIWETSEGHITYLGDWHTHPEAQPLPSFKDKITFRKNYFGTHVDQSLLIYIIVGTSDIEDKGLWLAACDGYRLFNMTQKDQKIWHLAK